MLSPPQGSGCRLVHSRMGMTSCLRALLLMPPLSLHLSTGISQSLSSLAPAGRKWGCFTPDAHAAVTNLRDLPNTGKRRPCRGGPSPPDSSHVLRKVRRSERKERRKNDVRRRHIHSLDRGNKTGRTFPWGESSNRSCLISLFNHRTNTLHHHHITCL